MLRWARQWWRFGRRSRRERFEWIFRSHYWQGSRSRSGGGSSMAATEAIRERLPGLLERYGATSMLDAGCGDHHWMREVDLGGADYLGVDIVGDMVERNRERYGGSGRRFEQMDLVETVPPAVDLILCRDVLYHLSFRDGLAVLENFRRSGSRYLLGTTYPGVSRNRDIVTGAFAFQNLELPPFSLPAPVEVVEDTDDERLALWECASLTA